MHDARMQQSELDGISKSGAQARAREVFYFDNPHHISEAPFDQWAAIVDAWLAGGGFERMPAAILNCEALRKYRTGRLSILEHQTVSSPPDTAETPAAVLGSKPVAPPPFEWATSKLLQHLRSWCGHARHELTQCESC